MRPVILLALVTLTACTDPIIMKNPQTGETADCGSHYGAGLYALTANDRAQACVRDFQAQGWQRTGNK